MSNTIIINKTPIPREKETYSTGHLWKNLLTDDFQKELSNLIKIELLKNNDQRFPLCSEPSIFIEIYTSRTLNVAGVLKNTLDAINGLLITDDIKVKSVLIRRHTVGDAANEESIQVGIMDAQPIISIDDTIDTYSNILFLIKVDTVLEDRYLPTSSDSAAQAAESSNRYSDGEMANLIRSKYYGRPATENIKMFVEFTCKGNDGDLDNLFLTFGVPASNGVIVNNMTQIDTLLIKKNIVKNAIPTIKVTWE